MSTALLFLAGAACGWCLAVAVVARAQAEGRTVTVDAESWAYRLIAWTVRR